MEPLTAAAVLGGSQLLGGLIGDKSAAKAAKKNANLQREFAQQGIQWKVKDALKAGVSPEYALGASTHSAAPVHVGGNTGNMIADAGQNIVRSVLAAGTKEDRILDQRIKAETARGMTLDNDIKHNQLTSINSPKNPAFPSAMGSPMDGQANASIVDTPLERVGQSPSARHSEGGSIPSVGWAETPDGGLMPIPSQGVKERIEDQLVPETMWAARHLLGPNLGKGAQPPKDALPKGYKFWRWSFSRQAYYPSKGKPSSLLPPAAIYNKFKQWRQK